MQIEFLNNKMKKKQFFYSYGIFVMNGMVTLSVGSLLPFIRDARSLNYIFMGLLISLHSIGNLSATLAGGIMESKFGRRLSSLILSSGFVVAYLLIVFGTSHWVLALAFFLTGIARGTNAFFCNTAVNNLSPGKAWIINGLHGMFAIGAFSFPLVLTALTLHHETNWIYMVYFMIFLGIANWSLYFLLPVTEEMEKSVGEERQTKKRGFLKEPIFYFCTAILFFYLSAEQGVVGWLVTYFKDTNLLSDSLAQIMASVLWMMILIGRLVTAWLSTRFKKVKLLFIMACGMTFFFFVLIFSQSTTGIVLGIIGFGLSMAGVYPTTVSCAGHLIKKYPVSWSLIATAAALGAIFMHNIIGSISEKFGIFYGMASIAIALLIVLILIVMFNVYIKKNPHEERE